VRKIAVAPLLALAVLLGCVSTAPRYEVRFGRGGILMDGEQPRQYLLEETTIVPRDVDGMTGICFSIRPPDDEIYETYSVHYLPSPPGDDDPQASRPDGGIVMPTERVRGERLFSWGFDDNDPLGPYRIQVFVNGSLVAEKTIEVVD
jgi:hypothetical protein